MKKALAVLLMLTIWMTFTVPSFAQLQTGDVVTMGTYEQDNDPGNGPEAIEWQVLAVEDGQALLLSRYGLEYYVYDNDFEDVTWADSDIRAWLNGEFFDAAFSEEEKGSILSAIMSNPDNAETNGYGGDDTEDRVFLLSIDEARTFLPSDDARRCAPTASAKQAETLRVDNGYGWWWLRTPGSSNFQASLVTPAGLIGAKGDFVMNRMMIRPAIRIAAETASGQSSSAPILYTVQEGDTCQSIAASFGVDVNTFMSVNHLTTCSLKAGDLVIIPGGSETETSSTGSNDPGISAETAAEMAAKGESAYWDGDYETALTYLIPAAEAGNSDAQFRLGYMYSVGEGVESSDETAVYYYQLSADQGDPYAQVNLGLKYELGRGVAQSYETAAHYYQLSADQGLAAGQYSLALLYEYGNGVTQSYETAVYYYQLAADQGHAYAQNNLGVKYEKGLGVAQDYEMARYYYELSAAQGNQKAQENLDSLLELMGGSSGTATAVPQADLEDMYTKGEAAYQRKDYSTAWDYLLPAADGGHIDAQFRVGYMYDMGRGVTEDDKLAVKYYTMAADQGHAGAQYNLGIMYQFGEGVTASNETAAKYYQMAADQGHVDAQYNLGVMYEKGEGVPQSNEIAVQYYQMTADAGDAWGQCALAYMYENGKGVAQDYEMAVHYYQLSADQGFARAQNNLGVMYEDGRGVAQDYEMALYYYQLAADQGNEKAIQNLAELQEIMASGGSGDGSSGDGGHKLF